MTAAEILVTISQLAQLFRDADGDTAYATVDVNGHGETWPVRSKGFRRWLVRGFYGSEGKPPGAQAVADALGVIEAKAQFASPVVPVRVRVASDDERVYLDLADESWRAVEVTSAGWYIASNPPVKFRRARGMLPLPAPTTGSSIDALREFVNVEDEPQWKLLIGWVLATLRGAGPFPVLALGGEHGSAKTTTGKVLRSLVDPNQAMLRAEPRDVRDVMISARNGWIVALDNISSIESWLSDCLCRLATGGGFSTRELFTDDGEVIFDAKRPVMINGIEDVIDRADLLDRALLLNLPVIGESRRVPERDFWRAFDSARPAILGALLTAVSAGLARESGVRLEKLPRMADFAVQVTAAASAFGWEPEDFLTAYRGNRAGAHESLLEGSPLAVAVRTLNLPWSGTASELLQVLNPLIDEATRRERWWPKTPKGISGALKRLAPNLRAVGIEVAFSREARRRTITIKTGDPTERHLRHRRHEDLGDCDGHDAHDADDAKIPALSGQPNTVTGELRL
jgi:hypothetical protein